MYSDKPRPKRRDKPASVRHDGDVTVSVIKTTTEKIWHAVVVLATFATAVGALWQLNLARQQVEDTRVVLATASNALEVAKRTNQESRDTIEVVKRLRVLNYEGFTFNDTNRVIVLKKANGDYYLTMMLKERPIPDTVKVEIPLIGIKKEAVSNFNENTFQVGLNQRDFERFASSFAMVYYSSDTNQTGLVTNMVYLNDAVYMFYEPTKALTIPTKFYESIVWP